MLLVSIGAVAVGLVVVAALFLLSGGSGDSGATAVSEPDTAAPAAELRQGRTLVAPDAVDPVVIDTYEDPQCPACGLFTKRIEPLLIADYVATGKVSYTYHDFVFLGEESWDGATAMRVAEDMDGKFWDYHNILFHNQSGENEGAFSRERLADMAELIGLDRDQFLQGLDDPSYREAITASTAEGSGLGVSSTPTIFVDGEPIVGVPQWNDLRDKIEAAAAS
jgi:protein-disulfide isomerase